MKVTLMKTISLRGFTVAELASSLATSLLHLAEEPRPVLSVQINGLVVVGGRVRAIDFGDGGVDITLVEERPPPPPPTSIPGAGVPRQDVRRKL